MRRKDVGVIDHGNRGAARLGRVLAAVSILGVQLTAHAQGPATPAPPPSGLRDVFVISLAVSPVYARTGTVVAIGASSHCEKTCYGVWVTHDGGHSWLRTFESSHVPAQVAIAVDSRGHEVFYGGSTKRTYRSDDGGHTWNQIGSGGIATVLPSYAKEGKVIVAEDSGPADYLLHESTPDTIEGSSGSFQDVDFGVAPQFPNGGRYSPALLAGIDPTTRYPVVLRCDANFVCAHPTRLNVTVSDNIPGSFSDPTLLSLSDDFIHDGVVFADTPRGLFKSTDGGASFTAMRIAPLTPGSQGLATPAFALAPGYREAGPIRTAYAGVAQLSSGQNSLTVSGGIYSTTDGGATWAPLATSAPLSGGAVALAVAPDGRLFAGYRDADSGEVGLVCSADGGHTWLASCPATGGHLIPDTVPIAAQSPTTGTGTLSYWIGGLALLLASTLGGLALRRRRSSRG